MAYETQTMETLAHPVEVTTGMSLLDYAEVLDQHRMWVESGGERGARAELCGVNLARADLTGVNLQGALLNKANLRSADLSLANLRGASLVQADLRDTNLLGTDLRGTNLMGATLYGAEGVWIGKLGGANLFEALLPESLPAMDGAAAIAQSSKATRWFYFLLMTVSATCCALIALTTRYPAVAERGDSVRAFCERYSMSGFYLGAPLLLCALSLYFHFLLLRLWGNMETLPAVSPDGGTLEKVAMYLGGWPGSVLPEREWRYRSQH